MNDDPLEARAIARVQDGDTGAYDYLVSKYLRRVVAIASSIVRNPHDAEDLAQEAFVKAYRSIGRFRAEESFGPWISRIVIPRAYMAMIFWSKPVKRRSCLPMICGSNEPSRSRGTSMARGPRR